MRARDFIKEYKQSPDLLMKKLNLANFRMGFECEVVVPNTSSGDEHDENTLDLNHVYDFDELRNIIMDYFSENSRESRRNAELLEEYYQDWAKSKLDDLVNIYSSNYEEEVSEEEIRQDVLEKNDVELSRNGMFDDQSAAEVVFNLDLQPNFGWVYDTDGIFRTSAFIDPRQKAANILREKLGIRCVVFDKYHADTKYTNNWYVEPDSSIVDHQNDFGGAEIVSPVFDIETGLKQLNNILSVIRSDFMTNNSTGLHISLSKKGVTKSSQLDLLKLVIFSGQAHVLQAFNRENNNYTKSQIESLKNKYERIIDKKGPGVILNPRQMDEFIKEARLIFEGDLKDRRESFINFDSMDFNDGRIEFRAMGGEGYEDAANNIRFQILRFIKAIDVASDPNALRKEYITALMKVFNLNPQRSEQSKPTGDLLIDAINISNKYKLGLGPGHSNREIINFLYGVAVTGNKRKISFTAVEIQTFRKLYALMLKSVNASGQDSDKIKQLLDTDDIKTTIGGLLKMKI